MAWRRSMTFRPWPPWSIAWLPNTRKPARCRPAAPFARAADDGFDRVIFRFCVPVFVFHGREARHDGARVRPRRHLASADPVGGPEGARPAGAARASGEESLHLARYGAVGALPRSAV